MGGEGLPGSLSSEQLNNSLLGWAGGGRGWLGPDPHGGWHPELLGGCGGWSPPPPPPCWSYLCGQAEAALCRQYCATGSDRTRLVARRPIQ